MCSDVEQLDPLAVVTHSKAFQLGLGPRADLGVAREGELPVKPVALREVFEVDVGVRANAPVASLLSLERQLLVGDVKRVVLGEVDRVQEVALVTEETRFALEDVLAGELGLRGGSGSGGVLGLRGGSGSGGVLGLRGGSGVREAAASTLGARAFGEETAASGDGGNCMREATASAFGACAFGEETAGNLVFGRHGQQKGRRKLLIIK
jgi:hypothetical protein